MKYYVIDMVAFIYRENTIWTVDELYRFLIFHQEQKDLHLQFRG